MAKTMESWAKDRGYVYPHIRKVEGICAGRPCIDGTRVRVLDIVFLQKEGYTPEQMLEQYPDLNLAQVHAAAHLLPRQPGGNRRLYRGG